MRSRRCRMPETAGLGQLREKKRRREFTIRYTQPRNWLPPVDRANGLIELGLIVMSPANSLDALHLGITITKFMNLSTLVSLVL